MPHIILHTRLVLGNMYPIDVKVLLVDGNLLGSELLIGHGIIIEDGIAQTTPSGNVYFHDEN